MPRSHRRKLRAALFSASALVSLGVAPSASAAEVSYQGSCFRTAEVVQWTPKKGAVARFVADTFASSTKTGLWVGLGWSGTSFWSAEGGDQNDACDDCRALHLVETKADGKRTRHTVFDPAAHPGAGAAARKAHVLATLWRLASKTWPADKLQQSYTLTVGKPPAKDPDKDPPFAVKVAAKGTFDLRYDLGAKTSMCWCLYDWRAKKG